ncbi:MAG: protease inhibitor I42 family protein [Proteobacteria bacterium]|nr:protease inhibitor I42 family protein [Pseudomonadota bacterium]
MLALLPAVVQALELTERDSGRSVSVPLAETVTVTLAGNPTTGYIWEPAAMEREILVMDPEPSFAPDSFLTGAGGKFTFRFTPRKPGKTSVKLIYHRPWEKDAPPLQTFTLTVSVPTAKPGMTSARYRSASGEVLTASFDLNAQRVTVTFPDGRKVTLPLAVSASGARFCDGTETFWEHQGTGRFFKGETLLFQGTLVTSDEVSPQPRL